ncbi:DUF58 domain-containing protein [Chloroflexota bacterium]
MVKIRPILLVVPLFLLVLALAGGSILLLRLFSLTVLVLLTGYLWTVFGSRGISVQAKNSPEHCQVGESFDEEVTVFNSSKLPKPLLRVEENTDLPGNHNISALSLPPRGSSSWQNSIFCQRRGYYSLGSITVTASDPFGFFSKRRKLGESQYISVFPATLDLPFFSSASPNDFGYGTSQRSISQISPNASSVREFTTGDSLNHIHWLSTAHTGKLMVKVFDADRSHSGSKRVWVINDMHQAFHLGEGNETTEEYGVTITASLIKKYLDSGMPVGLIASGDQPYFFPPEHGEQHLRSMMKALTLMKATGKVPIEQLISDEIERFKGNSIVIIITPSGKEQIIDTVRQLKNRGNSAAVVFLDATSFGGTINPIATARSLNSIGAPAYIVRKGDDLARVLDNRVSYSHVRLA